MLSAMTAWMTSLMADLGYPGLFVMMALESTGAPIPAEIVLPLAGYMISLGTMNLGTVLLAANLGGLAGFLFQYAIGRYGGRPLIRRFGKYFYLSQKDYDRAEQWFVSHGPRAVFIARMVPVIRGLISLPAGVAGMPPVTFSLWSLAGAFPWNLALVLVGLVAGDLWPVVMERIHQVGVYALVVAAPAALLSVLWYRKAAALRMREGKHQ